MTAAQTALKAMKHTGATIAAIGGLGAFGGIGMYALGPQVAEASSPGMASMRRHQQTDFGSPWKGIFSRTADFLKGAVGRIRKGPGGAPSLESLVRQGGGTPGRGTPIRGPKNPPKPPTNRGSEFDIPAAPRNWTRPTPSKGPTPQASS